MDKQDLLKQIADTAYNIGYGAKRHFATYDIVDKTPERINFLVLVCGVFGLIFEILTVKFLSATFVVMGIIGLYISFYKDKNQEYEAKGVALTKLFNELKVLYYQVKSSSNSNFEDEIKKLKDIEDKSYTNCISKQILFSDWYAHFKFFWQHQIDWVNEQKQFKFLRDKLPLSFSIFVVITVVAFIVCYTHISNTVCNFILN